ncbi:MAG: hypothetical protein ABFD60_15680 [Bryobacteraceae bacterium]
MGILALLLPAVAGWFIVRLVLPSWRLSPCWAARVFEAVLGAGLGVGASSLIYFVMRLCGASGFGSILACDLLLLVIPAAIWWRRRRIEEPQPTVASPAFRWNALLAGALAVGFLLTTLSFIETYNAMPHGEWDAWSTWNARAKFLASDGDAWRNAWSPLLVRTHPGYPLLLSGVVARTWRYGGTGTPSSVPAAVAYLFLAGTTVLLVTGVGVLWSASSGLLAGLLLLAGTKFVSTGMAQYADVPLSFYMLATLVLITLAESAGERRRTVLALAGVMAGLAAWTKSEGLLFLCCVFVGLAAARWREGGPKPAARDSIWFMAGSLPGLAVTLWFKLVLVQSVDPEAQLSLGGIASSVTHPDRYVTILEAFWKEILAFGGTWTHPLLLIVIVAAVLRFRPSVRRRHPPLAAAIAFVLLIVGYVGVYVTTPVDLKWLLGTSLGRLGAQVWPSAILLLMLTLGRPEDAVVLRKERSSRKSARAGKGRQ